MNMLLHFIFFLHVLILAHINGLSINSSNVTSNLQLPIEPERSFNRTRREDKLKHTAVCAELDQTEDNPFVAIITTRNYGRLLCMGSIIDEYHVLTAKSCCEKSDAGTLTIIAGFQSPYWGRNSQVKFVDRIHKHDRDLAIIVLKRPFQFTETVKPVKIIGPEKMNDKIDKAYLTPCAIVGFQLPKYLEQPDFIPREMNYHLIYEKFDTPANCTACYEFAPTDDILFCTEGNSEFTWGGNGSPTVITIEKEYVQIGVLVTGMCNKKDKGIPPPEIKKRQTEKPTPNLHARTDRYYKWIKANSYVGR